MLSSRSLIQDVRLPKVCGAHAPFACSSVFPGTVGATDFSQGKIDPVSYLQFNNYGCSGLVVAITFTESNNDCVDCTVDAAPTSVIRYWHVMPDEQIEFGCDNAEITEYAAVYQSPTTWTTDAATDYANGGTPLPTGTNQFVLVRGQRCGSCCSI